MLDGKGVESRDSGRHAGAVTNDSAAIASSLFGSAMRFEMTIRLGEALELTGALWDLGPLVGAAGEMHDLRTPEETADRSRAGRRLDPATRSRLQEAALRWAD